MYMIQHSFICRPSDSTMPEDAALLRNWHGQLDALRNSARSHPLNLAFEIKGQRKNVVLENLAVPALKLVKEKTALHFTAQNVLHLALEKVFQKI